jgi:HEAT repeat protein
LCAESIVREGGLKALFEILQKEENDKVRAAIAEALFMFVVRNEVCQLFRNTDFFRLVNLLLYC